MKIPENTLHGWFKSACELLKPLYDELKKQVLTTDYAQVDETTLPVINKQSHKAVKEYLWMVRAVTNGLVFFYYDDGSRSQETARNLFKPFKGYLQCDGYTAYNVFDGKEGVCLVGCLAHIRRHYEVTKEENMALAENTIRPIALSRKNFLFCGNHEAAENTAVICSLLVSCKASSVNPREWLTYIIARLPYYTNDKRKDMKELLPNNWKQENSKEL